VIRKFKTAINWLIRGKDDRVHLIQVPNVPLIGWFVLMIVSKLVAAGSMKTGLSGLSMAFLAVWCYLEITQGMSRFRRMLGVVVALLVVRSLFS